MSEFSKLSPRKQKYVKGVTDGMTKKDAALEAGYAATTALRTNMIETPDVRAAFAEVMRKKISADKIAQRVAEGLDAIETKHFAYRTQEVVEPARVVTLAEDGKTPLPAPMIIPEVVRTVQNIESRDVIAWSERRQYAALAVELGGYFIPPKPEEARSTTNILIQGHTIEFIDGKK